MDLIERLYRLEAGLSVDVEHEASKGTCGEAADEIERLRDYVDELQQWQDEVIVALGSEGLMPSGVTAKIARYRKALEVIAEGECSFAHRIASNALRKADGDSH